MKQFWTITLSTLAGIALIWGSLASQEGGGDAAAAVRIENGTQIIHIVARGGYSPRRITAQADLPTQIEMETKGTYDCSSWLTIPDLNYAKQLPSTGVTLIDVPPQSAGTTLVGLCSMGMYSFEIGFDPPVNLE